MSQFSTLADRNAIEAERPWAERDVPNSVYERLSLTADRFGDRSAVSFQILSGPKDRAETLTWRELHGKTTQAANLFRKLGVGEAM